MNYYNMWFNRAQHVKDHELVERINRYLGHLKDQNLIAGWRLMRRKFGFGPPELGEFHVMVEVSDLVQLEKAFNRVARRDAEIEDYHSPVYSSVTDFRSALFRDFPDQF